MSRAGIRQRLLGTLPNENLPVYALEGWQDRSFLGGFSADEHNEVLLEIELAFQESTPGPKRWVRVRTVSTDSRRGDLRMAVHRLAGRLALRAMDDAGPDADFASAIDLIQDQLLDEERTNVPLTVDGEPVAFTLIRDGSGPGWVMHGDRSSHAIIIAGEHIEPTALSLVTVLDIEPFLGPYQDAPEPSEADADDGRFKD